MVDTILMNIEKALRIAEGMKHLDMSTGQIRDYISTQVDLLYPPRVYEKMPEPQQKDDTPKAQAETYFTPSLNEATVDEALAPKVEYMGYSDVISRMTLNGGLIAARKVWDNVLNMEYIQSMYEVGIVKCFESAKADAFKSVVHSYKPSNEDISATDWYFLNPEDE